MRLGRRDIALHWGNSFACDFISDKIKFGWIKDGADTLIKVGGTVIIVSKFVETG